jgi:two-component system nitrogen regulation response regulator NtrX
MTDSILIVDDEDGVRRTMTEWLISSGLPVTATAVADAESALVHANTYPVDLAILDWNLGTGADGLRLLEDLIDFQPNLVAILVTGFAAQATPLHAMRMGVRDYLDKNADFTRETFLASVRKQLAQIAPAKRQREIAAQLKQFRESVEQILPLIGGSAKLNEPVPLPDAVRSLMRFTIQMTGAGDGAIVACRIPADGPEQFMAYAADGTPLPGPFPPFSRSLLAAASSAGRPVLVTDFTPDALGPVDLLPVERNRNAILLAPFAVGQNVHVAMELFDKTEFTDADRATAARCAEIGTDLARMIMADRQSSRVLFDAVESALRAADRVGTPVETSIVDRLKSHFRISEDGADAASLELIDAIRNLAQRHGPRAVAHCQTMVTDLSDLLDAATGAGP